MRFIELIREYAKRLKIDDTLNEDGSIDITYGGEIAVNFHLKGNKQVVVMALIDVEGRAGSEYDLQYLMRVHLSRTKTDDAILSIDPKTNELVLYDGIDISDINVKKFEERVGLFINSVRFWRERTVSDTDSPDQNAMRFFP